MYYYLYIKAIMNQDLFDAYAPELKANLIQYYNQLDPIEKKAYHIAKEHLGSSFNIVKSNGFCDWLKEQNK